MGEPRHRRIGTVAAIVLLALLATWLGTRSESVAALDRALLDRGANIGHARSGGEVLLVAIDEKSLARMGRWPWSRARHAELLNLLRHAGAGAIGLDLLLAEPAPGDRDGDAELATAIAAHGKVLLPVPPLDSQAGAQVAASMATLWPAALFVHSDIQFEPDGMVRNIHRWAESGNVAFPALPLAMLNPELAVTGARLRALSASSEVLHWQRQDAVLVANMAMPEVLPVYSYADVLAGRVDPDIFRGRRVLVGVTAPGLGQRFMTPRSSAENQSLSGVQLSAVAANELAGGYGIRPVSAATRLLASLGLVLASVLAGWWLPRAWALAALLGGLLLTLALTVVALRTHALWIGTGPALLGIVVGAIALVWERLRSARRRAEQVMRDARQLASGLVEAVVALTPGGEVEFASAGRSGLLPEIPTAGRRPHLPELVRTVPPIQQLVQAHGRAASPSVHQAELVGPTGVLEPVTLHIAPSNVYSESGLMVTLARRTDPAMAADQGAHRVDIDPLTGLTTRGYLWSELELRAGSTARSQGTVLVLLALDGFKRINEALGVGEGDRVLVEVARRLRTVQPQADVLSRWSGDQFAALLPCRDDGADVSAIVAAYHNAITTLRVQPGEIIVNASVGAAAAPAAADDLPQLVQRAERAMREVKRSGGGRWLVEGGDYAGWTRETLAQEQELRHAIVARQFFMEYQPIMDVAAGRFASMEALIRWRHPQRGVVGPGGFLDLAEEVGLEIDLGELAFDCVRQDMRTLAEQDVRLPVSVNVSARHFERPDFPERIAALEMDSPAAGGGLKIEVTESMALIDPARAARQVLALEQHGVGVALDDFGCGHSSLALLRSLRIRQVKIDRSFVSGAEHDAGAQALVRAIIGMAQALGLEIVAEGVETQEQSTWLRGLGCHLQQGYLFARPMPAQALPGFLRSAPEAVS